MALATNSPACCVALLAGEEAEEAMEVSVSEDPAETEGQEAQETTQAVGVSFAAVPKHFLLHDPAGTTIC